MSTLSRRNVLKTALTGATMASFPSVSWSSEDAPIKRKGNIRQSVSRWCYQKIPLDQLCEYSAKIEEAFRKTIPLAAKAGVPNVITFSGNREGMSDEEGAKNTIIGLNRVKKIAEDNGVNICIELLNSKVDHHDYMCDHSAWGLKVVQAVNSPRVKLLYDIYHMQIMEGDLVRTIQKNIEWMGHFHTGGVPGRHELDGTQEVQWDGVMRGIAATNFKGYVAHEFVPTRDPLTSLRQAVDLCDV